MGTVVKRKRGGALLGELTNPGQTLLVARGGKGGLGVVRPAAAQGSQGRGKFLDEVIIPAFNPSMTLSLVPLAACTQ
jgi:hypothetical protein